MIPSDGMSSLDLAARTPLDEAASGFLSTRPPADERSAKERSSRFARPAIGRSSHLEIAARLGVKQKLRQDPIRTVGVEDPKAAAVLPGKWC
jgi:hypothetical protein